jgi:Ca2+-binding RTX toxin-like protein
VVALVGSNDQLTVNGFLDGANQVEIRFADGTVVSATTIFDTLTTIAGTPGADTLNGTQFADRLLGLSGNDTLTGLDGNDRLDGGTGADFMQGGNGDDEYWVDDAGDQVSEAANAGFDVVNSTLSYTLPTNVDGLRLLGLANINATGNTLDNDLVGNDGNNVLNGGSGADWMVGGRGADTYVVGSTGDIVIEDVNAGVDTVQSNIAYTLGANVENLTLTGSSSVSGTGNDLNNTLVGNTGANALRGGLGNDLYVIGSGDTVTENSDEGVDTVQSSVMHTLGNHVENLTLSGNSAINGTGNDLSNVLTGNSAVNTLSGGAGNDTYIVGTGDIVSEAAGAGTDTIMASVSWTTLASNVENLTLTGTNPINGTGNTLSNVITGNSAANALNGGAGADTLIGGAGNDSYTVDNTADVITELANEGVDSVSSNVSYTLSANVENLTLTGTSALNGTGNTLDNVLTGNSAINTLTGGMGNDTYFITSGDVVVEAFGEGTDTIQAGFTYTLLTNSENLTLTGTSAINATGNEADNILTGNSAINTLRGLGGNDTYVITSGDVLVEASGAGTDTVLAGFSYTLLTSFENLSLTGSSLINGTGNTDDNVLTGNSANNTLSGLGGNDTYIGGAGNDALTDNSTTSNDIYRWGIGQGNDTITDAGGSADRIEISAGVAASQVTLTRSGNHLLVGISGATDVLTVANWYIGTANKIEEIRLADGTVIGGGAAPLSLVGLPSASERMFRLADPTLGAPIADDPALLTSAQSLVQAMAQFDAGAGADQPWVPKERHDSQPTLVTPW